MARKQYYTGKKDGSFWVYTPSGKRIVVPHKTAREARQVALIFNQTNRDESTVVTFNRRGERVVPVTAQAIAALPDLIEAAIAVRDGWERNLTGPMALLNAALKKAGI